METPLFLPSDERRLFGVLHRPEAAAQNLGLVLCAPFAEEQKQGYRVLVELARRLTADGVPCLRFDYRGTGDSEGPFTDFTLTGAAADIRRAAEFLRQETTVERVGLVGLRLGGSLAWRAAVEGLETACVVLWQPIVDGALFYKLNLRRMLIRQMMTAGKAEGERAAEEGTIDLDGFVARRSMCEELKEVDLSSGERPECPVLVCQFAHSSEPTSELAGLVERLGPDDRFLPLVLEPFWQRLGYVDCSEAIEATAGWLAERVQPSPA
jgi:pimeloyl-ACP methyl ester carboxylesterase